MAKSKGKRGKMVEVEVEGAQMKMRNRPANKISFGWVFVKKWDINKVPVRCIFTIIIIL